jgi:hypothetical protein
VNDLRPLISDCESDLERAILSAGRSDSSDLRKAQVLAALGVGSAVTLSSSTSSAATLFKAAQSVFTKATLAKKVVVASVVAGTGFAGVVSYGSDVGTEAVKAAPVDRVAARERASVPPGRDVMDGIDVTALPMAPPEREGAQAEDARDPAPERSQVRVRQRGPEASLNDEVELLDRARAAINGGRPNDALVRLDEHSSKFPKGGLALEAQVLRVQALAAAGRNEEASRRAKRILSRSPNSVVAKRLRQYVTE